jgi:ABC-type Fe3+/spermidine/putrescine transport system ATPase subunit
VIECRDVSARAGSFALRDVTFAVPAGAHAILTGPTASGKTTLLELIAGATRPMTGAIRIAGSDVTARPPEARGVGFVPQHGYLFPHLDVRRNIEYGARDPDADATMELARRFGVSRLVDRAVSSLSGGERQLVALCRALASRPRVLLLDEPVSALDSERRDVTLGELAALQVENRFTVLHVTHQESDSAFATVRFRMADGVLTSA